MNEGRAHDERADLRAGMATIGYLAAVIFLF